MNVDKEGKGDDGDTTVMKGPTGDDYKSSSIRSLDGGD